MKRTVEIDFSWMVVMKWTGLDSRFVGLCFGPDLILGLEFALVLFKEDEGKGEN